MIKELKNEVEVVDGEKELYEEFLMQELGIQDICSLRSKVF